MPDQPAPAKPVIAYFTSAYARAADSFIRGEVAQLRALGFTVHTFSVNKTTGETVSDDILREQQNTEFVLEGGKGKLFAAAGKALVASPGRFLAAMKLAFRTSNPGIKGRLWAIAYVLEACWLAGRLQARGVQHVHNHIGENSAAITMLASVLSGIPYSLTIHGPGEFDHPMDLALNEKIGRSKFTLAICEYGRSQLFRWTDQAHWGRIHIVHCGLDDTFLAQPITPVPQARRFVSIGRLSEQKGQLLLVQAAAKLAGTVPPFEVVLIGDGPMRRPIEKLIDQHKLRDTVKLAGWMSSTQIRDELLRSRAMALPSFAEGLPVVIMEALALCRPVISTYVAGIPELVQPGRCGWLVPAGSVDALVDAMRQCLSAPQETLDNMGQQGRTLVHQSHNAQTEAGKLAAHLIA